MVFDTAEAEMAESSVILNIDVYSMAAVNVICKRKLNRVSINFGYPVRSFSSI